MPTRTGRLDKPDHGHALSAHGLRSSLPSRLTKDPLRGERTMLIKHSARTVRRPCKYCGRKDLYWAHDTDRTMGIPPCEKCGVTGKFQLVEPDGVTAHVHSHGNSPEPVNQEPERDEPWSPEPSPAEPVSVPDGTQASPVGQDKLKALEALSDLLSPKVDAGMVRQLIADGQAGFTADMLAKVQAKIDAITAPVVVHVKTGDNPAKPIEGLTHKSVPTVLTVLNSGEHVLMVGPAGTGKSTIADQCAQALELAYYSISLSPQTPASALLGYMQAAGEYVRSLYREAFEHGGVFHFDEFDNAHPSVLAVINASLANGSMAFPDRMVKRHPDFRVCASANTYGRGPDRQYVGRQALDAATLDRFTVITIDIDIALETELCKATGASEDVTSKVLSYVRALRANAETHKMTLIFSPRASVGMCRLINAGLSVSEAIDARARRGASDQDWAKVSSGVSLPRL